MRLYLIKLKDTVVLGGIAYQGIILMAQTTAKAIVKFRNFCDKQKISSSIETITEVRSDTIIGVKDASEYRWDD